ncbi:MAG: NHL repeat-containing protein, partial [Acidobacteriota bacterium]
MRQSWITVPVLSLLSLTGCGMGNSFNATTATSGSGTTAAATGGISGRVHGGNQPITGSDIHLFTAGTTGYGSLGTDLLASGTYTTSDGSGQGNSNGNPGNGFNTLPAGGFTITGDYTCPADNPQVFLVAFGGNPGLAPGTNNSAIELLTALSDCNSVKNGNYSVNINEVTTVGTAYALSQFLTSGIGSYGYSQQGMLNAVKTFHNIIDIVSGTARSTTLSGTGTGPQQKIHSLANALAPCVNSTSPSSSDCLAMDSAVEQHSGRPGPSFPNVLLAALDAAVAPGNNTSQPTRAADIFNLSLANAPFQPALTSAPNDWTIAVSYSTATTKPMSIAVDAVGNIWTANYSASTVSLLSPTGVPAANSPFGNANCSGCFNSPRSIAIDPYNNVWVANQGNGSAMKLSSINNGTNNIINTVSGPYNGVGLSSPGNVAIDLYSNAWFTDPGNNSVIEIYGDNSGSQIISGGTLNAPNGIAFDTSGNAWVANLSAGSLVEIEANGQFNPNSPYTGGGLVSPQALALDGSHHLWITNTNNAQLAEFTDAGAPVSSSSGITGGGIGPSSNDAVDGAGNVWVLNRAGNSLSELSSSGTPITPSTGYVSGTLSGPVGLAIDASGNIWVGNGQGTANFLTEFIGLAAPTITPLATALQQGQLGQMPGTPVPVGIESVTLPAYVADGTTSYSAQLYAFGGNSATYAWSATGLPSGLTISSTGLISGTSTAAGTNSVTATVCDGQNASNCASKVFTLSSTSYNPALGNEAALNGKYAFRFTGVSSSQVTQTNPAGTQFGAAFIGNMNLDGAGNITGSIDINVANNTFTNLPITGTYSLGADGRGTMFVHPSGLSTVEFVFSVGNFSSSIAQTIHFIEFDDTNAQGSGNNSGAGIAKRTTAAAFSAATLNQSFAFGLSGETPCTNYNSTNPSCPQTVTPFGPVALAGIFTGNNSNAITSGEADGSGVATTFTGITLAGSYTNPDANGRGTLTLNPTGTTIPFSPTHYVY